MNPFECPDRRANIDDKKTFCIPWNKWTNCLERGHCTYETADEADVVIDKRMKIKSKAITN